MKHLQKLLYDLPVIFWTELIQEPGVNPVNVSITPLRAGVKEIVTVIGNI